MKILSQQFSVGAGLPANSSLASKLPQTSKLLQFKALALALLLTLLPVAHDASAQGVQLTPADLAQLNSLTEEERQAILNQAGGDIGERQQQIPEEVNLGVGAAPAPAPNERVIEQDAQQLQGTDDITSDQVAQRTTQPLRQFGYELFGGSPSTFAPATNIPVPANYVMGPGDTVVIQLYGQRNLTHELVITREGMLMFPEIGPVSVAGLSYQELRDQIQNIVANQLIGQNASVTMGALRSINVFVLGEAVQPGSYTVSSLSTMTNALFASGGVTRVGSLRNVRLMRTGELVTELDLYDLLLRGDTSGDARLLPGDVIFIPTIGKTVGIAGEVRRPAIYELKDETSPADILALSGGLNPTAFPSASRIERITQGGQRTVVNVDLSPGSAPDPTLLDGDVIQVFSILDQVESIVMLEGHVQRPGSFEWRDGMRVSDVIPSIGDMLPNPDLDYALIARETQPTRRIELLYVNLGQAIAAPGSAADIALQPRDQVLTFGASLSREDQLVGLIRRLREQASFDNPPLVVNVRGNVRFPGEYPLVRGMALNDVISYAGGLSPNSALGAVMIERQIDRSGQIQVFTAALNPETLATETPVGLQELDEIVVFNANEPRDALLESTLQKLRSQASATEPTRIVNVTGSVRYPGSYPLLQGLSVDSLIRMAGGLSESAETRIAEVTRYDAEPEVGRVIGHVPIDLQSNALDGRGFQLAPFDQLVVRQMPNWTENEFVFIEGEVNSPGRYSITKEDTLSSLIARAGGLTPYAEARAAIFLREELRENEQGLLNEYRERLEREIITQRLQPANSDNGVAQQDNSLLTELLASITQVNATGRLVINAQAAMSEGGDYDVILRTGDRLIVPRTQQEVTVVGEVNRPTSHLWGPGLTVADYIDRSGGYTPQSDERNVYVIKANGEVISFNDARWFFEERNRLEAGDSIVVPFKVTRPSVMVSLRNISQLLFNVSTTLLAIERVRE
jgi:polysaccharide export outer membrane protein